MASEAEEVESRFALWHLLETSELQGAVMGVHELTRYLAEPGYALSPAQTAKLFASSELRRTYQLLKAQLAIADMPSAAAASDGDIVEREITGGTMRLTPSLVQPQFYLTIAFDPGTAPDGPSQLFLEGPGGLHKLALPAAEDDEIFMLIDGGSEQGAAVLKALRDPLATGALVLLDAAE